MMGWNDVIWAMFLCAIVVFVFSFVLIVGGEPSIIDGVGRAVNAWATKMEQCP